MCWPVQSAWAVCQYDAHSEATHSLLLASSSFPAGVAARSELEERIATYVDKAKHARIKEGVVAGEKHLTALLAPTAIDLLQHCPPSECTRACMPRPGLSLPVGEIGERLHASAPRCLITFRTTDTHHHDLISQTCGRSCTQRVPRQRRRLRACWRSSSREWT